MSELFLSPPLVPLSFWSPYATAVDLGDGATKLGIYCTRAQKVFSSAIEKLTSWKGNFFIERQVSFLQETRLYFIGIFPLVLDIKQLLQTRHASLSELVTYSMDFFTACVHVTSYYWKAFNPACDRLANIFWEAHCIFKVIRNLKPDSWSLNNRSFQELIFRVADLALTTIELLSSEALLISSPALFALWTASGILISLYQLKFVCQDAGLG